MSQSVSLDQSGQIEIQRSLWVKIVESPKWGKLKEGAIWVAKQVYSLAKFIFAVVISVILYIGNPTFFTVGLIVGLAFHERARKVVERIKELCVSRPWVVVVAGVAFVAGTVIAPPVPLAAAAFLYGAYVSSKLCSLVPDYQPGNCVTRFLLSKKKPAKPDVEENPPLPVDPNGVGQDGFNPKVDPADQD